MGKKLILTNFILLDGSLNMKEQKNINLEINNGIISKLGSFDIDKKSKVIDLKGQYLMPGLINLHAHLPSSGKVNKKKKISDTKKLVKFIESTALTRSIGVKLCAKYAREELYSGVTTIRSVGGVGHLDSTLRNKINSNKILGPRLFVSDYAIGVPNGHMDGTVAKAASSIDEALLYIDDLYAHKVDLIKLMITGGVLDSVEIGKPARLRMSQEMVKACCEKAHSLGMKVAAHVESPEGIKLAIENGVDSIEHSSYVDDDVLNILKERNGYVVVTYSPAMPLIYIDPSQTGYGEIGKVNSTVVFEGMRDCASKCLNSNILLGLGTDTGSPYATHYNFYRELIYFTKINNVDNNFALHTATEVNATILGIDKITGTISLRKSADLIVIKNNPLEDLTNLNQIDKVFIKGKMINHPKNKHFDNIDKELDTIANKT